MLLGSIDEQIARGVSAPIAIDTSLDDFGDTLAPNVPDTYIQEKVDDVDADLRSRLLDQVTSSTAEPAYRIRCAHRHLQPHAAVAGGRGSRPKGPKHS